MSNHLHKVPWTWEESLDTNSLYLINSQVRKSIQPPFPGEVLVRSGDVLACHWVLQKKWVGCDHLQWFIYIYIYMCLLFTVSIISDWSKYQHHQVYVAWRFEALWILSDWTAWEAPVQHKWCSLAKGCFTVLRGIRWMSIMKVCCFASGTWQARCSQVKTRFSEVNAILRSPDTGWCSIVLIVLVAYTHFGRSCKMLKTCEQRFSNERCQYMIYVIIDTVVDVLNLAALQIFKVHQIEARIRQKCWASVGFQQPLQEKMAQVLCISLRGWVTRPLQQLERMWKSHQRNP